MSYENLIFTVSAKDRPGIIKGLSDIVLDCQGNWLDSQLSRLCGRFSGIANVQIPIEHKPSFLSQLNKLSERGVVVTVHVDEATQQSALNANLLSIQVEANDRAGIVDEIASALAANNINVEQLTTQCESASMAGYSLFKADLVVALPSDVSESQLETILENVSDDLMLSMV